MDEVPRAVARVPNSLDLLRMDGEKIPATHGDPGSRHGSTAVGAGGRRRRFWLLYSAAWIPYLYIYASTLLITGEAPLWPAILVALGSALPAAAFGLVVVSWTGWLATPTAKWPVFFTAHAISGVAYAVATVFATALLLEFLVPLLSNFEFLNEEESGTAVIFWQLFMSLLVYATIASIAYAFRSTMRLRKEAHRAARAEALQAIAELQALRAQINPHFLFNTLHSTLALVRSDSAAAEEAIEQFADLLRYTTRIHAESLDRVPLGDEWDFVENYLSLERLRLGDRLRVHANVGDDTKERLVPAFCLQPLVENAIRHGIAPCAGGGNLWISATPTAEGVRLEVRDDGPGCERERLTANGRLGLRLVRQRLEVLYGDVATFDVETAPGDGFGVKFWIPARPSAHATSVEAV